MTKMKKTRRFTAPFLATCVAALGLTFPGLYPKLPYDPLRDFKTLGLAVTYSYTLIGRKDLAQNTLPELIRFARDNPGKLTYASAGPGSG